MFAQMHQRPGIRNGILRSLPGADFACLSPFLQPVALKKSAVLQEKNRSVEYVSFIESGIVSLRTLGTGSILETATVGSQGMVGVSVALGAEKSIHQSIVLISGSALRIRAEDLQRSMYERPQIRDHFLQYVQALMIHGSQSALCGVRHELEQRVASWLCSACDAIEDDLIQITHDQMSESLGFRRAGVTKILIRFEREGLIRKTRGALRVCERRMLEQKACGCYGVISNAYYLKNSAASHAATTRQESPIVCNEL